MSGGRRCRRCHIGDVLAVLRLPHTWTNASGNRVRGVSEIPVCSRCDAGDPVTGPIVRYLTVHESVRTEHVARFARLLRHWIDRPRPLRPDENALKAEADAWFRGDL